MAIINPPEFMQNSSYTAKRWREAMFRFGRVQPGVWDTSAFVVTPAGSGWTFTVSGGAAYVSADLGAANAGLYHVEADSTPISGSITPAHATLPRIDTIGIQIDDSVDSASADDVQQIAAFTGTATSGATLGNRTGAPTLPGNTLPLYDILVPGGAGSIAAATIRDRRTMARGVLAIREVTSGQITVPTSTVTELAKLRVNIGRPFQNAGGPAVTNLVEIGFTCKVSHNTTGSLGTFKFQTQTQDTGTWTDIQGGRKHNRYFIPANYNQQVHYFDSALLAADNYLIRVMASTAVGAMNVSALAAALPLRFYIREVIAPVDTLAGSSP
jgi:hypothetical protein